MDREYIESFAELLNDNEDRAYEAAIAQELPTTEAFYPEWDGKVESLLCGHGFLDSSDCSDCLKEADF